ncbi:hypothetical protein [Myxosarcina sp. GI1(2024)]
MLEMKLVPTEKKSYDSNYDYAKIYVRVYCTLLSQSETSGFLPSIPSTQDKAKADAIAKQAGVHTEAIIEYLRANVSRKAQSAKS